MADDRGTGWERVRALFEAACDVDAAARTAFVRAQAGEDASLAEEVLELLGASDASRDRLRPPGAAWRESPARGGAPIGPGSTVGPYRLERTLASGGMGVVFLAHRDEPRRTVALKMIQLGFDDEGAVRRFRTEVAVLAALSHPGIAQVYESGVHEEDGHALPWFAMEYVADARTIVDHARERRLGDAERVDLMREVLDAVEHGHARGVVHRDLKPDNLLVGETGRPKVIDFGVARATGADLRATSTLTRTGTIVGTLASMSPEQLAGRVDRVDARTDVYALGVVLFELLCDAHPFQLEGLPLAEAARRVAEEAPRRPSALRRDLPRDLETIVMKALEKDPARRYASARAFERDLARFRAHEPIEARPPSMTYQARLFARRHRAFVAAMTAIAVVSLAAAAYSYRKSVAAHDAEALANRRFEEGRRLARGLLQEVFDELLGVEGATRAKAALAGVAMSYLDGLAAEAERDRELGMELVEGYLRLGSVLGAPRFSNLGDSGGALRSYDRALDLLGRLRSTFPAEASLDLAAARASLLRGRVASASGRHDLALKDVSSGLEALARLPEDSLDAVDVANVDASLLLLRGEVRSRTIAKGAGEEDHRRALARIEPFDTDNALRTRALVLERLGKSAQARGDLDGAAEFFQRHLEIVEGLGGEQPASVDARGDLHSALGTLGLVWVQTGRVDEARTLFERALRLAEPSALADEDDAAAWGDLGFAYEWLGSAERARGAFEASAAAFDRAVEIATRWRERDPDRVEWSFCAARRRFGAALARLALGRTEEARRDAELAYAEAEEACRLDPEDVAGRQDLCWGVGILFQILHTSGDAEAAIAAVEGARAIAKRQVEVDPEDAVMARHVVVFDDQLGVAWQTIGEDATRSNTERRAAYDAAIAAFTRSREGLSLLLDREQALPGDEGVLPVLVDLLGRCEAARAALVDG